MKRKIIIAVLLLILMGCDNPQTVLDNKIKKADFFANQGTECFKKAISLYENLLNNKDVPENNKIEIKNKLGNLYLHISDFGKAIELFKDIDSIDAKKKLAIAYFKNAQYSDALALFDRLGQLPDENYLYYYGQALEKHNLYDKAVAIYSLINKDKELLDKAKDRIRTINLSENIIGQEDIKRLLKDSPQQEDYPQAGALVILADETFEVFENNTAESTSHFIIKIFNERGKEEFSELQLGYDSTFEDIQLEYARTITPDGRIIYVGDKNIRDVSLYLNFPLYSNARARIISMPEVSNGAIIEYKAKRIIKQLVNKKDFILNYFVQDSEPIKEASFVIKLNKERKINYKLINTQYNTFGAKLEPEEVIVGDRRIYSWRLKDIPEIIPEPAMPPLSKINPIIMISSFNDWEEVYRWWFNLYKDKININDEIKQKIEQLIEGKTNQEDKVRAIYNFCTKEIRYVAVEYGQAGYEPHQAIDIFKNKYGDCKDQAILLIAMLRSIGIQAFPVLISTYGSIDLQVDFPGITFNHAIAVAKLGQEWIFMDPTAQTVSFKGLPGGDQERDVFVILDEQYKIVKTPLLPVDENASFIKMEINIDKEGNIYAKRSVDAKGNFLYGQRYWLQYTKPKLIEETLLNMANSISAGAHLEKYKIENVEDLDKSLVFEYEFSAPKFLIEAEQDRLIPRLGDIDISSVVREERKYPIDNPILMEIKETVIINLPPNLRLKYLPKDINITTRWFEFSNYYKLKSNTIIFMQVYKLKEKTVSLQDYAEYKKILQDISIKTNQNIILKEIK